MLKSNHNIREDIMSPYKLLNNRIWGLACRVGMLENSIVIE